MKRKWVWAGVLAASVAGFGGWAYAGSDQGGWRGARALMDESRGNDAWSSQRWRDDELYEDRDPRWREGDRYGWDGHRPRWRDDERYGYGERGRRWRDDDDGYGWDGRGRRDDDRYSRDRRGPRWREDDDDDTRRPRWGEQDRYGRGAREWQEGRSYRDDDCGPAMRRDGSRQSREDGRQEGYDSREREPMRRGAQNTPQRFAFADPARLDGIKRELSITAPQEDAWIKYAAAVKEAADSAKARFEGMDRGAMYSLSPDDYRKFRDNMLEQRRREIDSIKAAADALVTVLDEKQVAIAKEVLPGYAFGPAMRNAMGMGMGRGGMAGESDMMGAGPRNSER